MTLSTETSPVLSAEHADLLSTLAKHRQFLRFTLAGLSHEQATSAPTASVLSLAGIVKHVASTERQWVTFILDGPSAMSFSPEAMASHGDQFVLQDGETVESVLAMYDEVAARTTEVITSIEDLSITQPLPAAPWFEAGATWSARRVVAHLIAETAQHAGHADIIRETIDGQRTMG